MTKRRGKAEGSIFQRSDGRWVAYVHTGWKAGKPTRRYKTSMKRPVVRDWLIKTLREQQQGLPVPDGKLTVEQYMNDWLQNTARPSVRANTYEVYESGVRLHIIPAIGKHSLATLSPQDVARMLSDMQAKGLSPVFVGNVRSLLRAALQQAVKWGIIHRNVAALTDSPKRVRQEKPSWTQEQARAFLEAIKGDRLEAFYIVLLGLGLRKGEALALRWRDVDLDAGIVRITGSLLYTGGKFTRAEPKTLTSRSSIPMPRMVLNALIAHKQRELQAGRITEYVFTTTTGTPFSPRRINTYLDRLIAHAGLPRISPHGLRHTAGSLLLAQHIDLKTVSEMLRHASIRTTADIYLHLSDAQRQEVADTMDDILGA